MMTTQNMVLIGAGALCAVVIVVTGCGGDYEDAGEFDTNPSFDTSISDVGVDIARDTFVPQEDTAVEEDVFIPEVEEEVILSLPTASERFVFIANTAQNTVAKVDSLTLAITPIRVGREPTIVRTTGVGDTALVLNEGSDTITVIEASANSDRVTTIDIIPGCNELLISPDGDFAVAFYSNDRAEAGDEIGSLQDIVLIDLLDEEVHSVAVGFNVHEVVFDVLGQHAYVITDQGLNVVDMLAAEGNFVAPTISVGDGPLDRPTDREVVVSPDGRFALARTSTFAGVRVVDILDGEVVEIELPAIPTDIDLLPDSETALIALRDIGEVAFINLQRAMTAGESSVRRFPVDGGAAGVVTLNADATRAMVHTTLDNATTLGVLDISGDLIASNSPVFLRKGIRAVAAAPDANRALVVHSVQVGDVGSGLDGQIARSQAISVIDLDSGFDKLILLDAAPDGFVFTPDGQHLFVMVSDDITASQSIEWIDMRSFARRSFELAGLPETIGVVPGTGRVFISQEAEEGRLTFIDPADGAVYEVAAYELNAFIE